MAKVLFEITEENLETGMRGYPVGYCVTSSVDPQKGLTYVGIPVIKLAEERPEKVIFLLYHKYLPDEDQLGKFIENLKNRAKLDQKTVSFIRQLPKEGHPMKLFISALLICGMTEGTGNYREDCLNVIAKIPQLAAEVIAHHAGWKTGNSDPKLGYMENFSQMLNVPQGDREQLTRVFRIFNVLHHDHGGGNLSTFVGKAVASGLEDMYGSLAAAMCGLAGPRHGKANQDCLHFVEEMMAEAGENAKPDQIEALIRKRLENRQLIYGFGHAVLRVEDPRATVFYDLAERLYSKNPLVKMAHLLRRVGPKVLKENPKITNPYPNVDAISGILLSASGFHYPEYFTVLFGLARCVGIGIQIVYERETRDGKGLPIVRPKYFYKEAKSS